MTLDQMRLYAQAVTEQRREELGSQLTVTQIAVRGDKSSYQKLHRQLSGKNGSGTAS